MKTKIGFSLYLNGKLIDEVTFDRPIVNVGKLSTSNLRLDDINVSRKHAVIEQRENGQWRITDLGSTNGTIVRGERVVQADISDGDRLVLGTTTLIVHLDAEAVAKVEQREEAPIAVTASGQTGEAPPVGKVARAGKPAKGAKAGKPSASGPAEEIRGLGQESFFKKKLVDEPATSAALEVALLWGETVLAVETFDKPESIRVGEARGCRFTLPQSVLGGMSYELIKVVGGKLVLDVTNPNIQGDLLVDGGVKGVEELREGGGAKITLDRPIRARLRIGQFTLLVTWGQLPTRTGVRVVGDVDVDAWIYIAVSAILHIAFLIVISTLPDDLSYSQRDPRAMKERAIQVLRVTPEEEEDKPEIEEPEEDPEKKAGDGEDPSAGEDILKADSKRMIDVEMDPADRPSELVDKLTIQRNRERQEFDRLSEQERKERAEQMVQQTASSQALQSSALEQLLNTDPDRDDQKFPFKVLASRADADSAADFAGSVDPFGGTASPGAGGFLTPGGAPGGPGSPGGPAIAGVLDRRPGGRNLGDLDFKERPVEPTIIQMEPRLTGELDPKTVQQYIRRYLSGIKWCYQDRLQSNRRLGGKLTLAFTILPNGSVHNARCMNSTLGDADLERCISNKMARWRFPSPKDGGLVEVQYPLILKTQ